MKKIQLIILITALSFTAMIFIFFEKPNAKEGGIFQKISESQNSNLQNYLANVNLNWSQTPGNIDWSARYSHATLAFNNELWLMGGYTDDGKYKNDVWHSADGISWTRTTATADWSGRKSLGAAVFNNKMWIMGGNDKTTYKNDIYYSDGSSEWIQASASAEWSARHGHSVISFDNKLWVIAGNADGVYKNDVWYSSDGINWTQANANAEWTARYGQTVIVFNNKMWLIGGRDAENYKNDAWYSTDGISWTQTIDNADWSARYFHTSVAYANKIWLMGGYDDNESYKNDIWYSDDGVNWTQITSNADWGKRMNHTSLIFNDKIWLFGGYGPGNNTNYYSDVWSSDISAPTIDLKINDSNNPISIPYNSTITLSWTSDNANSCTASEGWSGPKPLSSAGEEKNNINSSATYIITCTNGIANASDSVSVSVTGGCDENWSCGDWSACANNQKNRTCADSNNCGTEISKPAITESCGLEDSNIIDGDLIRAVGDIDIYIVKYTGEKKFKRLILNPSVFTSYGHLKWDLVKSVDKTTLDSFTTSEIVRIINNTKVYKMYPSGDTGEKRWIPTETIFNKLGLDWDSIYTINQTDANSYATGAEEE